MLSSEMLSSNALNKAFIGDLKIGITSFYGWLRLLTRGQLTDPLLQALFIKSKAIHQKKEPLTIDKEANTHKSW